jgi:hypothetical protein
VHIPAALRQVLRKPGPSHSPDGAVGREMIRDDEKASRNDRYLPLMYMWSI